jgi:membrane associated rhomboid family serine protease
MGAYFLYFPFARVVVMVPIFFYPLFFEVPAVVFLLFWIATQVLSGTSVLLAGQPDVGGVAFWAHVGGFGAGLVLALAWGRPRRRRRPDARGDAFFR